MNFKLQTLALVALVVSGLPSRPSRAAEVDPAPAKVSSKVQLESNYTLTASYRVEVQLVRIPAAHHTLARTHLFDHATWNQQIEAGKLQVLESTSVDGQLGHESLIHLGGKIPIAYVDPRANAYQVQYVDVGFKFDVKSTELSSGTFRVDCRPELSYLDDAPTTLPVSEVFTTQDIVDVKPNQVAVLCAVSGRAGARFLTHFYPNQPFAPGDTVLYAISCKKI